MAYSWHFINPLTPEYCHHLWAFGDSADLRVSMVGWFPGFRDYEHEWPCLVLVVLSYKRSKKFQSSSPSTEDIRQCKYCWWFRNPANQLNVGSLSHSFHGFIHPRWLAGFLPSTVSPPNFFLKRCLGKTAKDPWIRLGASQQVIYYSGTKARILCMYISIYIYTYGT